MIHGLIPHSGFSEELLKHYYSPNLIFKNSQEEFLNLYCFIAKVDPWVDENNIPLPENTDLYLKNVSKNLIAIKKINTNDIIPIIKRIDWVSGTIYSQYSSNVNNGNVINYYVRNSYDQIFKCLYNRTNINSVNGSQSTIQPVIDFTTNITSNVLEFEDGYKWKYLFTIDAGAKLKFFDENWIPLPSPTHRTSIANNPIGCGEISIINVYNTGENYSDDQGRDITTSIQITGDGSGASAQAVIIGNTVNKIIMSKTGSNYTYANVEIKPKPGYTGNNAVLIPEISPIGGHGYNLINELGCRNIMITAEFNGTESATLPTDIDYRQIGLMTNPEIVVGTSSQFANSTIYRLTHDVIVAQGSGIYQQDEIVYQGTLSNPTYSGRVLNFNTIDNILFLINTQGTIRLSEGIFGTNSKVSRLAIRETVEQVIPYSGNIIYIENRTKVQRTYTGLEQFRLTLNY